MTEAARQVLANAGTERLQEIHDRLREIGPAALVVASDLARRS